MSQVYNTNADMMAGDTATTLSITITNPDGSAFNLTGYTASLQFLDSAGTTLEQKAMTISAPTTGVCTYTFAQADTYSGSMTFQVVITDTATGNYLTTTQRLILNVGAPLTAS